MLNQIHLSKMRCELKDRLFTAKRKSDSR